VISTDFKITVDQRRRLLRGEYQPLVFDVKPYGCQEGAHYVVSRSSAHAAYDPVSGQTKRFPTTALHWITVRSVKRGPDGRWLVRFDVVDNRDPDKYLRRVPPVHAPSKKPSKEEQSSYQTTRYGSPDSVPTVRSDWLDEFAKEASQKDVARLAESRGALEERLRQVRKAHESGVNLTRQIKRVEAAIEAAERRLRRETA
jgi:hypothetical protein